MIDNQNIPSTFHQVEVYIQMGKRRLNWRL